MTKKVQDIFGAAPKTVLNKPFMQVAYDTPLTGTGGTAVIGINIRPLNTVRVNQIAGASLSNNEVTLPAGTYYVQADCQVYDGTASYAKAAIVGDGDAVILEGVALRLVAAYSVAPTVAGSFTLASTTTIRVATYHSNAEANIGLGVNSNLGTKEVFTNLGIWRLDTTLETPVLVNDKLYPLPGNTMVTGNMHGLEYAKSGDNEVTVQAGICMDSVNGVVLDLATQYAVSIPTVINTIYNLFLCDDQVVRTDTDVNGANLGAYKIRWIGFVLTDASGSIVLFDMQKDTIYWGDEEELVFASAPLPLTWAQYSLALYQPVARVAKNWATAPYTAPTESPWIQVSLDGSTISNAAGAGRVPFPFMHNWYLKAQSAAYDGTPVRLLSTELKR